MKCLRHLRHPPTISLVGGGGCGRRGRGGAGEDRGIPVNSGSAEWANWSRCVLVIKGTRPLYQLMAAKRGARIGWKTPDGANGYSHPIAHSNINGQLFWRTPLQSEVLAASDNSKGPELVMQLLTDGNPMDQNEVLEILKANQVSNPRYVIKRMITKKQIYSFDGPKRATGRPPVLLSTSPPGEAAGKEEAAHVGSKANRRESISSVIETADQLHNWPGEKSLPPDLQKNLEPQLI